MAKILVVDDSEIIRQDLKKTLVGAGHEVFEAENGRQGLDKVQSDSGFHLIITDLNMPEMDGLTMCKAIRESGAFAGKPIFVLTTESSPELKAQGKENGVILWIVKPFSADKVIKAIEKVLGN